MSYSDSQNQEQNEPYQQKNPTTSQKFVVPNSLKKKMKACTRCHLIKTDDQWDKEFCQNCGHITKEMLTDKYFHVVSIINVESSWLRRKIRLPYGTRLVPGAYAVVAKN